MNTNHPDRSRGDTNVPTEPTYHCTPSSEGRRLFLGSLIVLGLGAAVKWMTPSRPSGTSRGPTLTSNKAPKAPVGPTVDVKAFVRRESLARIDMTEHDDIRGVAACLAPIDEFFDRAVNKTPAMIDDLFDIGSTVKVVYKSASDWWNETNTIQEYVEQFLDAYLGIPSGVKAMIEKVGAEIDQTFKANEQGLYRRLEFDLESVRHLYSFEGLKRAMELRVDADMRELGISKGLQNATRRAVIVAILTEVVTGAIARQIALALGARAGASGASATVAGAGAAGSPWTIGLSFLIGILVAVLIDWIVGKVQKGWAVAELQAALNEAREKAKAEARAIAETWARELAARRREAVNEYLEANPQLGY